MGAFQYDKQGNRIDTKTMSSGENAAPSVTGVRQSWVQSAVAGGLTPYRLAQLIEQANHGDDYAYLTLAEELEERNPHYRALISTRKLAVEALPNIVKPADDSPLQAEIAEAVEKYLINTPEFSVLKSDLLDGIGKGRSTAEMKWDFSGLPWKPIKYKWRDPRYFKFHPKNPDELRKVDEADMVNGVELEANVYITHMPRLKTGLVTRSGLARPAAVLHMLISFITRDWAAFSELFGLPIRVGKYGPNTSTDDIDVMRGALANLGSDAAALIPDSMNIEFVERAGGAGGGHSLFKEYIEWLEKQLTKLVLGQVASTEGTPGKLGSDDTQNEVRLDLLKADAKQLDATVNDDLIKVFVDLNWGTQEVYPVLKTQVTDPEDLQALTNAIEKLVPLGLEIKQSEVRNKFGLSKPDEDDDILKAPEALSAPSTPDATATNHAQGHNHNCPTYNTHTALNRESNKDALDDLADEALGDWQPIMEEILDPIQQLADESQDEDEFMARLPELLNTMEPKQIVNSLAKGTFKARGLGDTNQ